MQVGFIGLGKMGSRMASKLSKDGHDVIVWNRTKADVTVFLTDHKDAKSAETIEELVKKLTPPRVIWLMLPAGDATQSLLDEVEKYIEKGDIVVDGGNAHFSDTQKRFEHCREAGVRFLGIGVSGGIIAVTQGYPLMVGGDKSAYEHIEPMLKSLAKPHGGYEYFGQGGAGHYVKMVHNGMEYGFMQSLGEGFGIMDKSSYNLDLLKVAKLYQKGTLVSGFMLDRVVESLQKDPKLQDITGEIDASGEAKWTIEEGEKENVPVPIIKESLRFRTLSKVDERVKMSFAARMVAALRNAFGGHDVKKK